MTNKISDYLLFAHNSHKISGGNNSTILKFLISDDPVLSDIY